MTISPADVALAPALQKVRTHRMPICVITQEKPQVNMSVKLGGLVRQKPNMNSVALDCSKSLFYHLSTRQGCSERFKLGGMSEHLSLQPRDSCMKQCITRENNSLSQLEEISEVFRGPASLAFDPTLSLKIYHMLMWYQRGFFVGKLVQAVRNCQYPTVNSQEQPQTF